AARIHIAEADPGERGMYVLIDGDTDRSSYHRSVVHGLHGKVYPCCITLGRYAVVTHLVFQAIQTLIIGVGGIGKAAVGIQYYCSVNWCYGQRSRQRISFRVRIVGQYITGCRYVFRYRYVVVHRYRSSIDASNQIERISVLYVVIGQCSAIFQLCAAKEKLLLRRRNTRLILYLLFDLLNRITGFGSNNKRLTIFFFHEDQHRRTSRRVTSDYPTVVIDQLLPSLRTSAKGEIRSTQLYPALQPTFRRPARQQSIVVAQRQSRIIPHIMHGCHLSNIPIGYILVKRLSLIKHTCHIPYFGDIPAADILIEHPGTQEHFGHILYLRN